MERRQDVTRVPPLHLPPRELWRFTPGEDELLPTPIDERGLVNIEGLIALVKSTVDPTFTWKTSAESDIHHLYWEHNKYPRAPDSLVNPHRFCELGVNKIIVPRMFHEWMHLVTEEPPVPSDETMYYRIEAQRVVVSLFRTARQSKRLTRARYITDERLERGLVWHLKEFCTLVETAETTIPREFQPCDFSRFRPENVTDIHEIIPILGRLAVANTQVREVVRPLAA